jgi:hypothetical protein
VIDFALPLSIRHRHRCARTIALTSLLSRAGLRGGAIAPPGVTISFRPPRRCSRIGIRRSAPGLPRGNLIKITPATAVGRDSATASLASRDMV